MILFIHNGRNVTKIILDGITSATASDESIASMMFNIAEMYPEEIFGWCYDKFEDVYNVDLIKSNNNNKEVDYQANTFLINNPLEIVTFNPSINEFIPPQIGYIDIRSPFININKKIRYTTWMLSSASGAIYGKTLLLYRELSIINDFDCFLIELGCSAMKSGLFPYSEPELLQCHNIDYLSPTAPKSFLFYFVRRYYTFKLYLYLFIVFIVVENKYFIWPLVANLFCKKKKIFQHNLNKIHPTYETASTSDSDTVDIIIPTLGRPEVLRDFLIDLNKQTLVPTNVIIIEQKTINDTPTELDYLYKEKWKFIVKHQVIYQVGACNARNIAIDQITSKWTFFADDDIRIEASTLRKVISYLKNNNITGTSLASYRKGEHVDLHTNPQYWGEFSSGCSIVKSVFAKKTLFDFRYEFGFGEDTDYGCQLRNQGCSIVYYNKAPVFHLKAPVGGFRSVFQYPWSNEKVQPDPSPTEMKCILLNYNRYQFTGYKWIHYFKKVTKYKDTFMNFYNVAMQFNKSIYWANRL